MAPSGKNVIKENSIDSKYIILYTYNKDNTRFSKLTYNFYFLSQKHIEFILLDLVN
jgi:hypothetical protein